MTPRNRPTRDIRVKVKVKVKVRREKSRRGEREEMREAERKRGPTLFAGPSARFTAVEPAAGAKAGT